MKRALPALLAALILVACAWLAPAHATVYNLTDGNSSISIDTASQDGAYSWSVDGINQLYQQQYWYGPTANGQDSIDTLAIASQSQSAPNVLQVSYTAANFDLTVAYTLLGGAPGSGASDLGEVVRVNNTTSSPLPFNLYLYSDFDLGGSPGGDTATISFLHHATQTGKGWIADTIVTPDANHGEANFYANTLDSLNSGAAYTLNDNFSAGPGDATWALEWDRVIPAGGSFILSLDKNITPVPVPATALLLGSGLLGLVGLRFRKNRA